MSSSELHDRPAAGWLRGTVRRIHIASVEYASYDDWGTAPSQGTAKLTEVAAVPATPRYLSDGSRREHAQDAMLVEVEPA